MYEYQLGVVDNLEIDGKAVVRDYLEMNTAKFKTAIHIEDYKGKPSVVVQYNDALYSGELMRTLAKSVLCAVEHIIEIQTAKSERFHSLTTPQLHSLKALSQQKLLPLRQNFFTKCLKNRLQKLPTELLFRLVTAN